MISDIATIYAELDALCGRKLDNQGNIEDRYLIPWRGSKGSALAVVAPKSIDQVKALIRLAKKHGLKIVPQGARTSLVGGAVPPEDGTDSHLILSMENFRDVLRFDSVEKKVVVSSGYFLSEINEYLETYGVEVPINVSSDPMVGAMAATNIAGARVMRYGDFRKLCSGIEVVLADENESIFSSISKPVKDNSHLSFTSLFVGSFGQCGVITKVELDVVPKVNETLTAWLQLSDECDLSELISILEEDTQDSLLAVELVSANALTALKDSELHSNSNTVIPFDGQSDLVMIEVGGSGYQKFLEEILETKISEVMQAHLVADAQIVPSDKSWELRHNISEAVQKSGKLVGCDISVTKDKFNQLRNSATKLIQEIDPQYRVCDFGHLGDGGVHMNVVIPFGHDNENDIEKQQELRGAISKVAVDLGGSFSAEHGIGLFNIGLYDEFIEESVKYLSKGFKLRCDPENVLGIKQVEL